MTQMTTAGSVMGHQPDYEGVTMPDHAERRGLGGLLSRLTSQNRRAEEQTSSYPFTVLVVCRANLCRSPMMEQFLHHAAAREGLGWRIQSAGVSAQPGKPLHRLTRQVLDEYGLGLMGWNTTRVSRSMLRRADLILTASEGVRDVVVALEPESLAKVQPLLPLAHLLDSPAAGRPAHDQNRGLWLIREIHRLRPLVQPLPESARDIADPIDRPISAFRICAEAVQRATRTVVASVTPN